MITLSKRNLFESLLVAAAILSLTGIPFASVSLRSSVLAVQQPENALAADSRLQPQPRQKPPRPPAEFDSSFERTRLHADLTRWRTPDSNYFRSASGEFLIGKPDRTRCARWVLEYLTQDTLAGSADRDDDRWRADDDVPVEYRATLADYRNSGWQRGHLAASGNHVSSERAQAATYLLSNAVPQTEELNNGLLRKLEDQIRDRVKAGEVAWVLTAPIWRRDEQQNICARTIGEGGVWVPTHILKAFIVAPDKRRSFDVQTLKCETWLLPNEEKITGTLDGFRISVDEAESIAGFDIWTALPDDIEGQLEKVK